MAHKYCDALTAAAGLDHSVIPSWVSSSLRNIFTNFVKFMLRFTHLVLQKAVRDVFFCAPALDSVLCCNAFMRFAENVVMSLYEYVLTQLATTATLEVLEIIRFNRCET